MGGEMDNFKRSAVITEIEMCSGYQMKIRASKHYFPGDTDRICIIGGEMDDFERRVVIAEIEMCLGTKCESAHLSITSLEPQIEFASWVKKLTPFKEVSSLQKSRCVLGTKYKSAHLSITSLKPQIEFASWVEKWTILKEGSSLQKSRCVLGTKMQIRASEHYFPGPTDRICITGGEMDSFERSVVITEVEMCLE